MKKSKKLISIVLVIFLVLCSMPLNAFASNTVKLAGSAEREANGPLVAQSISSSGTVTHDPKMAYMSWESAAIKVRDTMKNRTGSLKLSLKTKTYSLDSKYTSKDESTFGLLYADAVSEEYAVDGRCGDYIYWNNSSYNWTCSVSEIDGYYYYDYQVYFYYYTTAAQEKVVTNFVDTNISQFNDYFLTNYQKIKIIYNMVMDVADYDNDHVNDDDYTLMYTAYAGVAYGKYVCQGYATLFYQMCKEAGLDCRVVTSLNHAWNIVRLDGKYYNVDATWDDGETEWDYFLKGNKDFGDATDHIRESWCNTSAFKSKYPVPNYEYGDKEENCSNHTYTYEFTLIDDLIATQCTNCDAIFSVPFQDLKNYEAYGDYVALVYKYDIMGGTKYNRMSPTVSLNRAMMVTILYRINGSPYDGGKNPHTSTPFTDIKNKSAYYYNAACWALDNGITTEKTFRPENLVTREQTVTFFYRYAKYKNYDTSMRNSIYSFPDYSSVSSYALEAMSWANAIGMITGTSEGYLNPKGTTQRIHSTKIISNFIIEYDS